MRCLPKFAVLAVLLCAQIAFAQDAEKASKLGQVYRIEQPLEPEDDQPNRVYKIEIGSSIVIDYGFPAGQGDPSNFDIRIQGESGVLTAPKRYRVTTSNRLIGSTTMAATMKATKLGKATVVLSVNGANAQPKKFEIEVVPASQVD